MGTPGYIAAAAGGHHSLGLKYDGSLWAWGFGINGQLGNGDFDSYNIPVQVLRTGWVAAAAGDYHSLGLMADGSLWAWGANNYHQLGVDNNSYPHMDAPFPLGTGYVAVAGGGYYSLALKADGSLWAWGDNQFGQLGLGDTAERNCPTRITGFNNRSPVAAMMLLLN
jgi:alpha-tubulin suppressor-like RCC1 family protein